MQNTSEQFVMVAVPVRLYGTVVGVIAESERVGAHPNPEPRDPGSSEDDSAERPWTRGEVIELAQRANAMSRAIMDLASAKPGKAISIRDAEKAAGVDYPRGRAQLGGLSKLVRRHFGRPNWPFVLEWAVGGENQAYYSVTEEVARWWREATKHPGK